LLIHKADPVGIVSDSPPARRAAMADVRTMSFELPGFGGELVHPGDASYDEMRNVFNGMIDRRPALIARCKSGDDVVAAINVAREKKRADVDLRRRPRRHRRGSDR
jgi:hypothetical protein